MEIYNVDLADTIATKPTRLRLFLILFAVSTPLLIALEWVWPGRRAAHGNVEPVIQATILSLVMSVISSSRTRRLSVTKSWATYQIVVQEDEIKTRNFHSWNRMLSRTIHRDEIRTVIEKEGGLLISSHGHIGAVLWGGIWIPKRLADYEYLRRLIRNWQAERLNEADPTP